MSLILSKIFIRLYRTHAIIIIYFNMKNFKSHFSKAMLVSTILVCLLLVYALYTMIIRMMQFSCISLSFWGICLVLCVVIFTLIYAFTQQIKYISITDTDLIIKKMCGNIIIPIQDIQEVVPKQSIVYDIRIWGISGLFGHIGWFWNKQTGRFFALVKDGNSMLFIKTKANKCYVISCQNHLQAMNLLMQKIQHLQ